MRFIGIAGIQLALLVVFVLGMVEEERLRKRNVALKIVRFSIVVKIIVLAGFCFFSAGTLLVWKDLGTKYHTALLVIYLCVDIFFLIVVLESIAFRVVFEETEDFFSIRSLFLKAVIRYEDCLYLDREGRNGTLLIYQRTIKKGQKEAKKRGKIRFADPFQVGLPDFVLVLNQHRVKNKRGKHIM